MDRMVNVALTQEESRVEDLAAVVRRMNELKASKHHQTSHYSVADLAIFLGWSASMVRTALGVLYGQGRVTTCLGNEDGPRDPEILWKATTGDELLTA